MDIKVVKGSVGGNNYFEAYSQEALQKFFEKYDFIKSVNVFFRGNKHKTKMVKLKAHFKGKDVFVECSAERYPMAIDGAIAKLKTQILKYKTGHYKKAVARVAID